MTSDCCWAAIHINLQESSSAVSASVTQRFRCLLKKKHRGAHKSEVAANEYKPTKRHFIELKWPRRKEVGHS